MNVNSNSNNSDDKISDIDNNSVSDSDQIVMAGSNDTIKQLCRLVLVKSFS